MPFEMHIRLRGLHANSMECAESIVLMPSSVKTVETVAPQIGRNAVVRKLCGVNEERMAVYN